MSIEGDEMTIRESEYVTTYQWELDGSQLSILVVEDCAVQSGDCSTRDEILTRDPMALFGIEQTFTKVVTMLASDSVLAYLFDPTIPMSFSHPRPGGRRHCAGSVGHRSYSEKSGATVSPDLTSPDLTASRLARFTGAPQACVSAPFPLVTAL